LLGYPEKVKRPIPKENLGEQVSFMPQTSYTTFGESIQDHIRVMTELFTTLENVISEEDHVVQTSHSSLFTVMLVARFRCHLLVGVIIFFYR